MQKTLPLLITFVVGIFMIGEFFIPHYQYRLVTADFLEWGLVLAAAAYLLGLVNLIQINVPKVFRRETDWGYKLVMLASLVVTLVAGFWSGEKRLEDKGAYKWVFDSIYVPLNATMFATLGFYVVSAAFRTFRLKSIEAGILMASALILIFGRVPLGETLWAKVWGYDPAKASVIPHSMNAITEWIMTVPNMAARRGVMLGISLGAIATSLKIILGIERAYLGGGKD